MHGNGGFRVVDRGKGVSDLHIAVIELFHGDHAVSVILTENRARARTKILRNKRAKWGALASMRKYRAELILEERIWRDVASLERGLVWGKEIQESRHVP